MPTARRDHYPPNDPRQPEQEPGPMPADRGRPIGQDHTKTADRDRHSRETPVVNPEPNVAVQPQPPVEPEPGPTRHGDHPPSSKKARVDAAAMRPVR